MVREWTPAEDALVGSAPDTAIAKLISRTVSDVSRRRHSLGIPVYRRQWSKHEDKLLGTKPDFTVAAIIGVSISRVVERRKELGIPRWRPKRPKRT